MELSGRLGKAEVIRDGNEAFQFAHTDSIHAKSVIYSCDYSNFRIVRRVRCFLQEKQESELSDMLNPQDQNGYIGEDLTQPHFNEHINKACQLRGENGDRRNGRSQ